MDFRTIPAKKFYGKSFQNLESALDEVYNNSDIVNADIVMIPPSVDYVTDEEDLDEENIRSVELPIDVPGEVEIFGNARAVTFEEDFDSDDEIPLSELKKSITPPLWTKSISTTEFPQTDNYLGKIQNCASDLSGYNEVEVFEKLFDVEVRQLIVSQTMLYAGQKNQHNFSFNEEDLKVFIGILLFSGYHSEAREFMYWKMSADTHVPIVANSMSRNRFQEIKRYIHFADNNNLDLNDKMAKLRPLSNLLCQKFQKWGYMHKHLSIDESMVKYFGRHSAKQFIRGKPVRFGFKNWMLCSKDGYMYQFDTYCGAKHVKPSMKSLPLGSRVVLDLLKNIEYPTDHTINFDNFFTSYDLMKILKEKQFRATGTARDNRLKKCPLPTNKDFIKQNRGTFHHQFDDTNKLLFVKWKDNSIVTNYDKIEPCENVKRWSKEQQKKINIPQPLLFKNYNQNMGGVDLHDQFINTYSIEIRGKKWWWNIFTSMISSTISNAWKLHKLANNYEGDLLEFTRAVTLHYLRFHTLNRGHTKLTVKRSIAENPGHHFPKKLPNQLRCRQCHQRSKWSCEMCNVTLCINKDCFKNFHITAN